jgi:hypothetical protein
VIGLGSYSVNTSSIVLGYQSYVKGNGGIAIGFKANSYNNGSTSSIAIGNGASGSGEYAIAIGQGASADANTIAIGHPDLNNTVILGPNKMSLSSGGITFNEQPKINGDLTPTADNDIATKKYVDDKIAELITKEYWNHPTEPNTIKVGPDGVGRLQVGNSFFMEAGQSSIYIGTNQGDGTTIWF